MDEAFVIAAAASLTGFGGGVVVGIGDDGALVTPARGHEVLVTDTLAEGTHFHRSWTSPDDLGWKALAVNVSDLAAMGASPRHALVSLALPEGTADGWVTGFFHGMAAACRRWRLSLVGGDTVRAPAIVITATVTGQTDRPLLRTGAQPGWAIAVTGAVGGAAAGLVAASQGPATAVDALNRWRRPPARLEAGLALSASGLPLAVTDCSDGLVVSCDLLAGDLGYTLEADRLPIDPAVAAVTADGDQARQWALYGGEDYELVVAVPSDHVAAVRRCVAPLPLTVVGRLSAAPGRWLVSGGRRRRLGSGFRHF